MSRWPPGRCYFRYHLRRRHLLQAGDLNLLDWRNEVVLEVWRKDWDGRISWMARRRLRMEADPAVPVVCSQTRYRNRPAAAIHLRTVNDCHCLLRYPNRFRQYSHHHLLRIQTFHLRQILLPSDTIDFHHCILPHLLLRCSLRNRYRHPSVCLRGGVRRVSWAMRINADGRNACRWLRRILYLDA